MHAILLPRTGGPDVLEWREVETPRAAPGEVVVAVAAAALNYSDLLQRRGTYSLGIPLPLILGIECSGTIVELGDGVEGWQVGERVCALVAGGAYAEQVAVPAAQLLSLPANVDPIAAAGLPEAACTVWSNLLDIARLRPGETVLVHGGAGGIGSFAIQTARAMGCRVFATAGGEAKLSRCSAFGADRAISYRDEDFVAVVRAETGGRGVDVILDNMGAPYLSRNISALAHDGRITMIGLQGGRSAEVNLGQMMGLRASLFTTSLRDRPLAEKARIVAGVRRDLWPLLENGRIAPVIDRTVPLREARAAHAYMEGGGHVGKILLTA
ncbi:NAD(P)H-quinone oxidoreductase [Shinella yambaruensis]|uniref:NAD(P)H quinone oxidoreductase n=1 Tax=Shinella yambaruensis TaxID=415996 RepID=A0ABQ5ZQ66_9HYPH|nr:MULTISPECIES: NAD(P)H-quinone oxidoreductase [Shinella]MCJ8029246.1 NAD(P)H-quinone oxidoreductase [Shinella yambaruensis]MCU7983401.1 NAD(P)H-quinone oxidoreductase [Shinella yambaruensis]MCW5711367.1 NAD(P)H-quinone oxidoreductase [Shinella sp.]GLR55019.1 NAD(P)H quinone oxidoreductase [Shinella yambaruensis]